MTRVVVLLTVALFVFLVLVLTDRSDDPLEVEVRSTSETTSRPLDPAATAEPGVTVPTTVVRLIPKARTAPSGRCGGDLPPCWVMMRESGGNIHAYNPTGCGGRGCYGKWQFSGEWACHFGLSCDIAHWTEAEQDHAARTLWDKGRGCAHWAAC